MTEQEKRETAAHHALAMVGGFFGVYALFMRGGTFGSSETSNLIYLVISGLTGSAGEFFTRLGATACYVAGIVFASLGRRFCRRVDFRLCALLVDGGACLLLAWIPEEADPVLALYPMFFATAVQWVAYSQAAGFNCATIFSTNNLRQCTEGLVDYCCTRGEASLKKFRFYGGTLLCFHVGAVYGWKCLHFWGVRSIYLCLPLVAVGLAATLLDGGGRKRSAETAKAKLR